MKLLHLNKPAWVGVPSLYVFCTIGFLSILSAGFITSKYYSKQSTPPVHTATPAIASNASLLENPALTPSPSPVISTPTATVLKSIAHNVAECPSVDNGYIANKIAEYNSGLSSRQQSLTLFLTNAAARGHEVETNTDWINQEKLSESDLWQNLKNNLAQFDGEVCSSSSNIPSKPNYIVPTIAISTPTPIPCNVIVQQNALNNENTDYQNAIGNESLRHNQAIAAIQSEYSNLSPGVFQSSNASSIDYENTQNLHNSSLINQAHQSYLLTIRAKCY